MNQLKLHLILVFSVSFLGCASLKKEVAAKKFVFERSWARHTVQGDYMGSRVNHVMEPILVSGLVIVGNEIDGLVAYERQTGQQRWRRELLGGVTAGAREKNGILYFGAGDGFFYAVDAQSGQTRWSFPLRAEGIGAPLVTDEAVYFLSGNNSAYALKIDSGEQIWFYSRMDSANITVRGASEPTISGQRLYLGFSDGYLVALNKDKGLVLWEKLLGETARFRDVDAKPVLDGDKLFVASYDGQLYCLDSATGQVVWQHEEGGFTPVVIEGSTLYYSTSTRKVIALEKSSGRVVWSRDLSGTVSGMPSVYRGMLIFGEWSGRLRAVDMRNGQDVTQYSTGRGVTSRPTVDTATGQIYVMTADANLFSLRLNLQSETGAWPWE